LFRKSTQWQNSSVDLVHAWRLPELHVFAVYPHRRFVSPKVKVFVEDCARRAAMELGIRGGLIRRCTLRLDCERGVAIPAVESPSLHRSPALARLAAAAG
jgi:hypothetical protein